MNTAALHTADAFYALTSYAFTGKPCFQFWNLPAITGMLAQKPRPAKMPRAWVMGGERRRAGRRKGRRVKKGGDGVLECVLSYDRKRRTCVCVCACVLVCVRGGGGATGVREYVGIITHEGVVPTGG